jgi:hypothetical protein
VWEGGERPGRAVGVGGGGRSAAKTTHSADAGTTTSAAGTGRIQPKKSVSAGEGTPDERVADGWSVTDKRHRIPDATEAPEPGAGARVSLQQDAALGAAERAVASRCGIAPPIGQIVPSTHRH